MLQKLLPADLYSRLHEVYVDPCHPDPGVAEYVSLFDGSTGEVIKDVKSAGMIRIDRNRMRKLCKIGLPIQFGKRLGSVTYGADGRSITVQFLDGTTAVGDILIGADGARSAVREHLVGKEKAKVSPCSALIGMTTVNFHDAEKARHACTGNPVLHMGFHPAGRMIMIGSMLLLNLMYPGF